MSAGCRLPDRLETDNGHALLQGTFKERHALRY